jgi:ribosomal protein S18 acetylase RimI-like enzyme
MEPLASSWGVQAVGMVELITAENLRRQGLATFLVGEALRQLHAYGISRCQVQAMESNSAALGLYNKLGFEAIEQGVVLRKDASSS